MHRLYNVKNMLVEELCEHGNKDKLTIESLKEIDTLAHAAKNVCKVIASCEDEYSGRYYPTSYGRHRDAMGRYSRDAEPEHKMPDLSGAMRGMSHGHNEHVIETLENLMATASDERTKGKFRELIRDMRNA